MSASPSLRVLLGKGDARALDAQSFTYDGRHYRGSFSRLSDGNVLSVVPLEAYLYSVVGREVPESWPLMALGAQAICARTYVLQRSDPKREYDLVTSESDQVYQGMQAETPNSVFIVDATAGKVLRFENEFAQIAYSSCCGGHTESSADAWVGGKNLPYLQGVACPWCTASPDYSWTRTIDGIAMTRAFPALGQITDVRVVTADPSGRARQIALSGSGGTTTVTGSDFRRMLGSRTVRSLLIKQISGDKGSGAFTIEGAGLGHGVGLCQWGCDGMAMAGKNTREILEFYFPGTGIGSD
jgi:stage II sporulation protein D